MKKQLVKLAVHVAIQLIVESATMADLLQTKLIPALIRVESSGNDKAIGDRHIKERAYGCLQIRKPCIDDVNRAYGTRYRPEDALGNRSLSIEICQKYIKMYATERRLGRTVTLEDMARIWNGGPSGWRRDATNAYWKKVQKRL